MKVASKAVMKYRDTKPLPSEITDERVNNATLPVKIETARRAIAACRDLPELLRYRDQAEGLAAAVRTMKHVGPEMIRDANCLMADAWRKGGELLRQYSSSVMSASYIDGPRMPSARAKKIAELGLSRDEANHMVRVAAAPPGLVYDKFKSKTSLSGVALSLPRVSARGARTRTDYAKSVLDGTHGLTFVSWSLRRINLDNFALLTSEERKVVKAKITEIVELLDEMDRLCR